jgi:deaminated glutathione amidase
MKKGTKRWFAGLCSALCLGGAVVCRGAEIGDGFSPPQGRLQVATCQFPVSDDISANGRWIRGQMQEARQQGAELVHFSECALSGYPSGESKLFDGFDWSALHKETESVLALAKQLQVWVVLGSAHRLTGEHKPHNSLYVINAAGQIVDRYDKRFCTTGDLRFFSPGDHFVTFELSRVKCGLLICYDIRFPELYRQYSKQGVQLMLHSFHNARQRAQAIHPRIMPATLQASAGFNYMYISANNSSAPHSWQSRFITPDGLVAEELTLDKPGVMVNLVDTSQSYYDASRPFRADCINGKLNSGEVINDPRSRDRTGY